MSQIIPEIIPVFESIKHMEVQILGLGRFGSSCKLCVIIKIHLCEDI